MTVTVSTNVYVVAKSAPNPPPAAKYDGWRLKHQYEGGVVNDELKSGMPEIYPSDWQNGIPFTASMQMLAWELMYSANKTMTTKQWRAVYKHDVAFTNYQGFDKPGDPRADYVNLESLSYELPKLMKVTLCGGSFYHGDAVGDRLWMVPGIHGIDANNIVNLSEVIVNQWYFHAVTWHDTATGYKINHFPQGNGGAVLIPLFLSVPVSFPLSWFSRWVGDTLPDPLKYY